MMLDPPLLPLPLPVDPLMLRWFAEEAKLWKGEKTTTSPKPSPSNGSLPRASSAPTLGPLGVPEVDATPPPELFSAETWHPPGMVERMYAADEKLMNELIVLELHATELCRVRHGVIAPDGTVQLPGRFQMGKQGGDDKINAFQAAWTTDGASIMLARLLYGGAKQYTNAMKALCKNIDAEEARRERAATILQSAARGRYERKHGKVSRAKAAKSPKKSKREQRNTSYALRKEAGGQYAGIQITLDPSLPIQDALRDGLAKNAARVMDLFRAWDVDGNGTIDKKEFRRALRALGVGVPAKELDELFDSFDKDKGGLLEAKELGKALRRGGGADIKIADELQAGAMGEIELKAKNRISIRKSAKDGHNARSGIEPTIKNIKEAMDKDLMRVKDLMNALDRDQDGSCTKEEFRQVLPILGFDVSKAEALDTLFDSFDADQGGTVDFEELHKLLRKTFEPGNEDGKEDKEREEAAIRMQAMMRGRQSRKRESFFHGDVREAHGSVSMAAAPIAGPPKMESSPSMLRGR